MKPLNFITIVAIISCTISSVWASERKIMKGHTKRQQFTKALPIQQFSQHYEMPASFNWMKHDGRSFLTKSMNQHLPTYCGSCWAMAAVTTLADRIKIIRMIYYSDEEEEDDVDGFFPDVALSAQFVLNCGGEIAGSCKGGSATGAFQFIKEVGYIPFETCQPYLACSSDSTEEFCKHIDNTCSPLNICKTCTRRSDGVGECNQVSQFPHAQIDEYGVYKLQDAMNIEEQVMLVKAEVVMRGPVTAGIAGYHLKNYTGGIIYDDETLRDIHPTHEVSIVGFDQDEDGREYWIIRNSWGEYWGEFGFFRLELGKNMLGIEYEISWATIKDFTMENEPCHEDGRNCNIAAINFTTGGLIQQYI